MSQAARFAVAETKRAVEPGEFDLDGLRCIDDHTAVPAGAGGQRPVHLTPIVEGQPDGRAVLGVDVERRWIEAHLVAVRARTEAEAIVKPLLEHPQRGHLGAGERRGADRAGGKTRRKAQLPRNATGCDRGDHPKLEVRVDVAHRTVPPEHGALRRAIDQRDLGVVALEKGLERGRLVLGVDPADLAPHTSHGDEVPAPIVREDLGVHFPMLP